jgi:DNA-binding XRE family transcriptional regulator
VRAYDRVKRRLETGEDEVLPAKFANRIIDGESAIRVWREYRGISAAELAKGAKIARPYLTQLETGKRAGTVNTISRLAGLLGVSVEDLFPLRR